MNFRTLLERVKAGEATPEETEQVLAEVEKFEAISNYVEERFNESLPEEPEPCDTADVQRLARRVKWRIFRNVLLSLLLVFLAAAIAIGGCNRYYYDPNRGIQPVYGGDGQVMIDMSAFTELHFPGYATYWAEAERVGPGCYQVSSQQGNLFSGRGEQVSLEWIARGRSTGNDGRTSNSFWRFPVANAFGARSRTVIWTDTDGKQYYGPMPDALAQQRKDLEELPASARVAIYVTFRQDLTLEEFARLYQVWEDSQIYFVYAAVVPTDGYFSNIIGFAPAGGGVVLENAPEDEYPCFELGNHAEALQSNPAPIWEMHFRSLVRYLAGRPQFMEAMANVNGLGPSYYQEILSYIDENGMKVFGALLHGNTKDILRFLDETELMDYYVSDVKLSILAH